MAILTDAEFKQMQSNSSVRDELNRKMLSLESQTIAWMAEAVALHGTSHTDDKVGVIALRDDLIARLTSAVALT